MPPVLAGLTVLDMAWGTAGAVTTMLLSDYGAEVIKIEPPGGDPFRRLPGYAVWNRGKKSVTLDLKVGEDADRMAALVSAADIFVESFSPGTTTRLGVDYATLRARNDQLIYCSITAYGRKSSIADRPGYDGLVQARSGLQHEQPGLRAGPVFLHLPLPSFGAALLASAGINAALRAREVIARGQLVETSLMQGSLLWTTQIWKRAERPNGDLVNLWKFKDLGPTPCFEAADGNWFHPMPQGVGIALAHVGRDPDELGQRAISSSDQATRSEYFDAVRQLYLQRPAEEWVQLLQRADVPCQPVQAAELAFDHPQVVHNRSVTTVDIPGVGPVTQLGSPYQLEHHEGQVQGPPPRVGAHSDHVLVSLGSRSRRKAKGSGSELRYALDGIRVIDFGTAVAGPFGTMILGDLGADVIKVEGTSRPAGWSGDATWVSGSRGKRCISVDLKTPEGQEISKRLIASADVVHYNLRTGVAERLGFGYDQVKAINPRIIFCHLTGYGSSGPLARWPGVDQMAQALCGLEYEQGATAAGGHPTWYRFGMTDAVTGMLTVIGVLQALYERERTGLGQKVEANILDAGMLLASDACVGPASLPRRPHLDRAQTGFGPYYRLYETAEGWICVAAVTAEHRRRLGAVLGFKLASAEATWSDHGSAEATWPDHRSAEATWSDHRSAEATWPDDAVAKMLEDSFATRPATEWFERLDAAGVPCERSLERTHDWYDDPDATANGWVVGYEHPVWGRLEQPGTFVELSETPGRIAGPPPLIGADTRDILIELGYSGEDIEALRQSRIVSW